MSHLWLRHEYKSNERRAPITPEQVGLLTAKSHKVTVESSSARVFADRHYKYQGAEIVAPGSWHRAPQNAFVLGIKEELQDKIHAGNSALQHRHIYFAHVFKGQRCTPETMRRFTAGKGTLLDLEYLVDGAGKRVAAFSYSAGFAGAIAAAYIWAEKMASKQAPYMLPTQHLCRKEFIDIIRSKLTVVNKSPATLVIGASGKAGQGAIDLFAALGIEVTRWGKCETAAGGPFRQILEYDIMCNCVFLSKPVAPFVTTEMVTGQSSSRLSVVADISNELSFNPIFGISNSTRFVDATIRIGNVDVIEIENLPSLTPLDSSLEYANQLFPHLLELLEGQTQINSLWERAALTYFTHHDIPQLAMETGRELADIYVSEPRSFTVENVRNHIADIFAKNPVSRTERLYFVDYLFAGASGTLTRSEREIFAATLAKVELDELYDSPTMRRQHELLDAVYRYSRSEDFEYLKQAHARDEFFELCDCLSEAIDQQPGAEIRLAQADIALRGKLGSDADHPAFRGFTNITKSLVASAAPMT